MRKYHFIFISLFFVLAGFWPHFALAAKAGEQVIFSIDSVYDQATRSKISATLRQISAKTYFYIEDDWWQSLSVNQQVSASNAIDNLSRKFDEVIYPKMTAVYGSEWRPGIDNDEHITVLITKMIDSAGGYFNSNNEYPRTQVPSSNEREMIYLNGLYINDSKAPAFLAHEFQHLITFYQKTKLYNLEEDIWLNEARSEYASTLLGYDNPYLNSNLEKRVKIFLGRSSDPLAEWRNESSDYGAVNLFLQYLIDHYGTRLLTLMTQNSKVGIASINAALQAVGVSENFGGVFTSWTIANYLNDCNVSSWQKYCYSNPNLNFNNLHILPSSVYSLANAFLEIGSWTKDWSPRWYKFDASDNQNRTLQIDFEGYGSGNNFQIPYILIDNNNIKQIYFMNLTANQAGSVLVPNFGSQIKTAIVIPSNQYKINAFTSNDPNSPFSLKIFLTSNQPVIYPDGTLIKTNTDSRVYLIEGGLKRWISSADIFVSRGFKWSNIKIVSLSDLSLYGEGKILGWLDGALIKSDSNPTVYVISLEKKRPFVSAEIFTGLGYQWQNIKKVSLTELNGYDLGSPINTLTHPDGALLKFTDSPNIYLIQGGQKRLIPSVAVFLAKGYDFKSVIVWEASKRNNYQDGLIVS